MPKGGSETFLNKSMKKVYLSVLSSFLFCMLVVPLSK
jgi:hypothetical protein